MHRWVTAALAAIMLVSISLVKPAPAAAAGTFTVVSSASYFLGAVPRGALLTIFTPNPVSDQQSHVYFPKWSLTGPGGLTVQATCEGPEPAILPILYIGRSGTGSQLNVYYPNEMGDEEWGTCPNAGPSHIVIYPAPGFGMPVRADVITVATHPGIFAVGNAPDGNHVDGYSGVATSLSACNNMLPANPGACRVRTLGDPAELIILLTGAEWFLCNPCTANNIIFELAPVVNGIVGTYVAQYLGSLVRSSDGVEKARIYVRGDTPAGEYRIRVRNTVNPDIPQPLTIELGQPA